MSATPARRIAFEVLLRVERGGAYASRALDAALSQAGAIDPREAGLATELVYGTLRRALALDAALAPHSRRPLDAVDPAARVALRLGAYQLLHLGTPAHAAVGETVALAKTVDHGRAAGFGPPASGIAALTFSASSGAIFLTSNGGGAGGATPGWGPASGPEMRVVPSAPRATSPNRPPPTVPRG
jgi:transcription termination factor NusB